MSNEVKSIALSILRERGEDLVNTTELQKLIGERRVSRHPLLAWALGESILVPTKETVHFAVVDLRKEGHSVRLRLSENRIPQASKEETALFV